MSGLVCLSVRPSIHRVSHCTHNTGFNAYPITFKLHMSVVDDERRNLIDFSQQRSRGYSNAAVRVWLGEWVSVSVCPSVRRASPCGHNTGFSSYLITFKLHMSVVDDERRNPTDVWSQGQRSRSHLALCV